jgi:hypothetical protein
LEEFVLGGGGSSYYPSHTAEEAERIFQSAVEEVEKTRIRNTFISFHVEDEAQVGLLRFQAKNNRFGLIFRDYSVKEPFDEKWKTQCSERISQTSAMICLIGKETANRDAVLWELEEAYRQGKEVIGVRIYRDQNHPIPRPLLEHKAPIINWELQEISEHLEEP